MTIALIFWLHLMAMKTWFGSSSTHRQRLSVHTAALLDRPKHPIGHWSQDSRRWAPTCQSGASGRFPTNGPPHSVLQAGLGDRLPMSRPPCPTS
ncbi:hypothetical protein GUJ93_ZPchr0016g2560 [Zizania palustris]|uniref:Secreted protein n=1 Tax=Zizania palustris TaxID=103762 RepID=A0A8J5THM5_ZIZPA|nr:hypothetical protein GUJ93_ZPchr0016g2560 [Zizania palustris]